MQLWLLLVGVSVDSADIPVLIHYELLVERENVVLFGLPCYEVCINPFYFTIGFYFITFYK